ncbi:MAG: class I SAM-dependent RNA methyltransferase [Alphaproteobacteria bacterium]|nr:class I SAM-dependent RNA methyltransferase [Alphaproteobacteria bacterium]
MATQKTLTSCRHFGDCGGCLLQDMDAAAYAAHKHQAVQGALAKAGVTAEVLPPIIVAPKTRRRAVFKIKSLPEGLHIGFHAAKSHTVIDMHQCEVLTSGLFALVGSLRARLEPVFEVGEGAELHVTQTDTGFDCAFRWKRRLTPNLTAELSRVLGGIGIARLVLNGEIVFETAAPTVMLGGVPVALPPDPFLQATADGEAALQARVLEIVGNAKAVADLFAGCGTFTLPLARKAKVHAVEQDAPALAALAAAARAPGLKPVTAETRDLFRLPLTALELSRFEAVVLDPPRAGAEKQAAVLAASRVPVIAYVSCDANSFARDAAILVKGGYTAGAVQPVDQFLWSSHIELVAGFTRAR